MKIGSKELEALVQRVVVSCLEQIDFKAVVKECLTEIVSGNSSSTRNESLNEQVERPSKKAPVFSKQQTVVNEGVTKQQKPTSVGSAANQYELNSATFLAESMGNSVIGERFGINSKALQEVLQHTAQTTLQDVKKNGSTTAAMANRMVSDQPQVSLEELFDPETINNWEHVAKLSGGNNGNNSKQKSSLREKYKMDEE